MKRLFVLVFINICLLSSCASIVKSPIDFKGNQLIAGEGGGFTGIEYRYILLENGQMFTRLGAREEFTALGRLDWKVTNQLFKLADQFNVDSEVSNESGNRYRFLEWYSGGQLTRNAWNPDERPIPEEFNDLNRLIIAIGNDLNKKMQ